MFAESTPELFSSTMRWSPACKTNAEPGAALTVNRMGMKQAEHADVNLTVRIECVSATDESATS